MKEYLDKQGGKYLAGKLKEYVNTKIENIPAGGTVDLSDYYNKEEVDQIISNLPSGGGTGTVGKDGVGISSIKLVNYELVIALTDGKEHNLGNVRGAQGVQGVKGADGKNGTNGVDGKDGAKGADGISPTVSVTQTDTGHTVAITDVNGTKSFDVLNGKDGKDGTSGGSSSGGSAIGGDIYSTDEIAIGTWIDGKTIYRKVVSYGKLPTISNGDVSAVTISFDDNFQNILRMSALLSYGTSTFMTVEGERSPNELVIPSNYSDYAKDIEQGKVMFVGHKNSIDVYYGKYRGGYNAIFIFEYIKEN